MSSFNVIEYTQQTTSIIEELNRTINQYNQPKFNLVEFKVSKLVRELVIKNREAIIALSQNNK